MLGNLFKAFFAWGNGFLSTERRSLSNSSYAILAIARSFSALTSGSMPALPMAARAACLGSQNLLRVCSNVSFECGERCCPTLVACQIRDVLPDD